VSAQAAELASPFGPTRLPRQAAEDLAGVMKALADPSRLMILSLLHHHRDGVNLGKMVRLLGTLSQATVWHHLGILVAAGVVDRAKEPPYVVHRINAQGLAAIAAALGGAR
jgi:ArsR family transcriptional regulator